MNRVFRLRHHLSFACAMAVLFVARIASADSPLGSQLSASEEFFRDRVEWVFGPIPLIAAIVAFIVSVVLHRSVSTKIAESWGVHETKALDFWSFWGLPTIVALIVFVVIWGGFYVLGMSLYGDFHSRVSSLGGGEYLWVALALVIGVFGPPLARWGLGSFSGPTDKSSQLSAN